VIPHSTGGPASSTFTWQICMVNEIWPAPQYVSDGVVVEPDGITLAYSCNDHLA